MSYAYAVQVLREDDTEVAQMPIRVDWEPAREALRLQALAQGTPAETAFLLECDFAPVWDGTRGQPYVSAIRGTAAPDLEERFGIDYFGELARGVTKRMVAEGTLQKGDLVRCLPVAFVEAAGAPALTRRARPVPPRIAVHPGTLPAREAVEDVPVLLPRDVLDETAALTAEHSGRETGGILIGCLRRDSAAARLFLEVTAQIPARHTEATSAKLTFTPATWTDVQSALVLRNRDEIMLGWWHSHPVREWCKECAPEKRAECALARGFLSEDDRLLHRTVFPRAYSIALVVNDVENGPTWSLFGWRSGLIAPREFIPVTEEPHATT